MHFLSYYFGISKQTEVLLLTIIGICATIFDESLIYLNSNLHKVWSLALDSESFSEISQTYIKFILSGIILVRSFTVHLYLAFYIVMLWPAIFEERPVLLLPWLLIGTIKSLLMNIVALAVGIYTCVGSDFCKTTCIEYLLTQLIDYAPSFYMWFCVLSYYRELKTVTTFYMAPLVKRYVNSEEVALRRRKVRSMTENSNLKHRICLVDDRHLISASTIENLVQQLTMHLPKNSRSLDTLLTSMAAEAVLMGVCEENRLEVTSRTLGDKAKKLLKLTDNDIVDPKTYKNSETCKIFPDSDLGKLQNLQDTFNAIGLDKYNKKAPAKTKKKLVEEPLRLGQSEKKTSCLHSKKPIVSTDALSEVSEIEIRPVLNYSTTTMATVKEALSLSEKVIQKTIGQKIESTSKSLLPLRVQPVLTYYVDASNQAGSYDSQFSNATQYPSETDIQGTSQTRDFTCQASTLSRNVLKLKNVDFFKNIRFHSDSVLSETQSKCSIDFQRNRCCNRICNSDKQISFQKCKTQNFCSFKTDGYTVAYKKQVQKGKCSDSCKRC